MKRPPDFIIIGAMKCATSTLHEQLARQPGVFMSNPKEPNFFSDDEQWERGMAWYESLFAEAPTDAICGESSTHYTKLPTHPHAVQRMKEHLPAHTKFIYIMRHPIDRVISHYVHEWTQRVISEPIDRAIEDHPELIAYSRYAVQLTPYLEAFGAERVLPVFFERMARHPQTELERISAFVGCGASPRWDDAVNEQNVSSERLRVSAVRDAVVNLPGLKQFRRAVVPKRAREWVKGFWKMKERPTLSPSNVERLADIFDTDLATLSRWFGVELRCDNFRPVAAATMPHWRTSSRLEAA